MTVEPVSSILGVKLGTMIAGFAGGVVSLAFVQGLSKPQAAMSVLVGMLTANYATPAVATFFKLSPDLQGGAAFAIGLFAMGLIPVAKKLVPSLFAAFLSHFGNASSDPSQGKGDDK